MENQTPTQTTPPTTPSFNVMPHDSMNDPAPKKSWLKAHMILGVVFLVAVLAAIVAGVYYWQTVRVIPDTVQVPVHKAKVDATADWQTYTNTEYGFEFKYPNNLVINGSSEKLPIAFDNFQQKYLEDGTLPKGGEELVFFSQATARSLDKFINEEWPGISTTDIVVANQTAKLVKVENESGAGNPGSELWVYFIRNGQQWSINFALADLTIPQKNQEIFINILSTFKFTK